MTLGPMWHTLAVSQRGRDEHWNCNAAAFDKFKAAQSTHQDSSGDVPFVALLGAVATSLKLKQDVVRARWSPSFSFRQTHEVCECDASS